MNKSRWFWVVTEMTEATPLPEATPVSAPFWQALTEPDDPGTNPGTTRPATRRVDSLATSMKIREHLGLDVRLAAGLAIGPGELAVEMDDFCAASAFV